VGWQITGLGLKYPRNGTCVMCVSDCVNESAVKLSAGRARSAGWGGGLRDAKATADAGSGDIPQDSSVRSIFDGLLIKQKWYSIYETANCLKNVYSKITWELIRVRNLRPPSFNSTASVPRSGHFSPADPELRSPTFRTEEYSRDIDD
jgi:hypothetical protein